MAVQSFVKGDDLKKLIDDKLINAQSVKYVLRQKGILPVCTNSEALSDLIHHHFFGSATMTQMQEVMNFEQNNLTQEGTNRHEDGGKRNPNEECVKEYDKSVMMFIDNIC